VVRIDYYKRAFHRDLSAALSQLTEVLPPTERDRFCRSLARVAADAPWPVRGSSGSSND